MKFVALVSGGKDSVYSILECRKHGHELLACVHLGAALNSEEESYMYQSAASEALTTLVEECIGVPLIHYQRVGKSLNTSLVYQEALQGDEVEDLYLALHQAKTQFPDVQAVSSGAILSTYQRVRIENVCSRLQLTSLSYLWRAAPQHDLLDRMIRDGITAVLVRAACPPGLVPQKHLNKTLQQLQPHFLRLNQLYQFHVCGEGGEYESLVLDCPLYQKKLVLDEVQVVELEGDEGVGVLKILRCHADDKSFDELSDTPFDNIVENGKEKKSSTNAIPSSESNTPLHSWTPNSTRYLPKIKCLTGGLWHVSEIMASKTVQSNDHQTEAELAVQEAQQVLGILQILLQRNGCTAQDVLFVHLYLSEISHFAKINAFYGQCFGTLLPPSRSCVAVGPKALPGGRRVLLDCMVQCGSGDYLRNKKNSLSKYAQTALDNTVSNLRQVLHVQSISHWAPVCVGPYSQVNTLRSGLHFMAGQIGLIPATMTLHPEWKDQLHQCWTNVASVLDALDGGSLKHLLSGVVYVADHIYFQHITNAPQKPVLSALQAVELICQHQMKRNGGIVAGKVDSPIAVTAEEDDDDSDNQEACIEYGPFSPLLVVSIPEMPVGSQVEVEVISATSQAAACLPTSDTKLSSEVELRDQCLAFSSSDGNWDTGHDFSRAWKPNKVLIEVAMRNLGYQCAGIALVTAGHLTIDSPIETTLNMDAEQVLGEMLDQFAESLSIPAQSSGEPSGLTLGNVLHVRLFYISSKLGKSSDEKIVEDDGLLLRASLQAALSSRFTMDTTKKSSGPASSVIPVQAIDLLESNNNSEAEKKVATKQSIFMALQLLVVDPTHLESEIWIQHGR